MPFAIYQGRMQKFTVGRLEDIFVAYNLACRAGYLIDGGLRLITDGKDGPAQERKADLPLGDLDGIVIGIAGGDPPDVRSAEEIPEGKEEEARNFFDKGRNPYTWFPRMLNWKRLVQHTGIIPPGRVDFLPNYPGSYYPGAKGLFVPDDIAFQYLGVESDHHLDRIQDQPFPVLYHDFRDNLTADSREDILDVDVRACQDEVFNFYNRRFVVQEDGTFGEEIGRSIEVMLEDSEKTGRDAVIGLVVFPKKKDREDAAERWGIAYEEKMRHTPFETYSLLKSHLQVIGADLKKTHITFLTTDTFFGVKPSRSESYIPSTFVYFTEHGHGKPNIKKKLERFSALPGCQGVVYTD